MRRPTVRIDDGYICTLNAHYNKLNGDNVVKYFRYHATENIWTIYDSSRLCQQILCYQKTFCVIRLAANVIELKIRKPLITIYRNVISISCRQGYNTKKEWLSLETANEWQENNYRFLTTTNTYFAELQLKRTENNWINEEKYVEWRMKCM